MAIKLGQNAFIGMGREAVWGTAATITDWLRIVSHGIKNNVPTATRKSLGDPTAPGIIPGTKSTGGDVTLECVYQGMECLLAYCFGAPTIQANVPVTGAHTWTFSPQADLYVEKGLTIEAEYDSSVSSIYAGCKVGSLAFNMASGQVLEMTASVGGRSWAKDTSPTTPTYPTDRPMLESELVMSIGPFGGAYAAISNVTGFNAAIENSLSLDRASLGSGYILEPQRNDFVKCTGSWNGDYIVSTYKEYMNDFTPFKIKFVYTSTYYITGTTPYSCTLEFPKAYVTGETPGVSSPGVIPETNTFVGIKDVDPAFRIVLITGRSALPSES